MAETTVGLIVTMYRWVHWDR